MPPKYPKRSIPSTRQLIDKVESTRSYEGAEGMGSMFSNLLDLVLDRGIMLVPDLATLDALTSQDAKIVAVKGHALFAYNPAFASPTSILNRPASGGGYWEYLGPLGKTFHDEVIGDSIRNEFTINHNLNTLTPTVVQVRTLTGQPQTYGLTAEVTIIDANSILLAYDEAPASYQFTISVKK